MLAQAFQLANLPVAGFPFKLRVGNGVVLYVGSRHVADQFLVLKLVERKAVALLRSVVVVLYVGNDALSHLQLHVVGCRCLLLVLVGGFEVLPDDGAVWDDVGAQEECQQRQEYAGDHVWAHEPLERHSRCQHRDNLRVAGQFRREENHGNEDEQRAEEIGEVRHEVGIVIKHNGTQRCVVLSELGQILVDVEDNGDTDNQDNREEICADEFLDNIPVESLDEGGLELLQQACHPAEVLSHPSAGLQESAVFSNLFVFHLSVRFCGPVAQ